MSERTPAQGAFTTATMAEVYLAQGHTAEALAIYRRLAEAAPQDRGLRKKIALLEQRLAGEEQQQRSVEAITRLKKLLRRVERRRREVEGA